MAGITLIGGPAVSPVRVAAVPRVEIKRNWWDAWQTADDLEILRLTWGTSQEIGELEVKRRYAAEVAQPYQAGLAVVTPVNYLDWWIRVRLFSQEGNRVVWAGRIHSEARTVYAAAAAPGGEQVFVAAEPLRLLQRITIGDSFWPAIPPLLKQQEVGWSPSFNSEDELFLVGNRSAVPSNGTHHFGGTSLWSRYEMVAYLLERFADEAHDDPDTASPAYDPYGPLWVAAGPALTTLQQVKDKVEIEIGDNVAAVLSRIISPSIGVDFKIEYLPDAAGAGTDGFQVTVFSLAAKTTGFAGRTFPANGEEIRVKASSQDQSVVTRIVRSHDQGYKRIRVTGKRVVACCTLKGGDGSLAPRWPAALESQYLQALSSDDGSEGVINDIVREGDRFEPVFQHFGAPADWEFNEFLAFPDIDNEGNFFTDSSPADPQYQTTVRRTLSWLPFRTGVDYTTLTPVDGNDAGVRGEPMVPQAWVKDEDGKYRPAHEVGFVVAALNHEWGLSLDAKPNHLLAKGHFNDAQTAVQPLYDYDDLVMTIAFETDRRLELIYEEPSWRPSDGELLIETDAELWFAAPDTVLGVNNEGQFQTTPTSARLVLRNDAERLYNLMAGAIARYAQQRARADVMIVGLQNAAGLIGRILTVVEAGVSDSIEINAPITSVEWQMGREPRTILRAGYAR